MVSPQLQSGDSVIPELVNIMITVKAWDALSTFKSPKISCFYDKKVSPSVGGAPRQKPYLKNGTVENFLDGAVVFSAFKWPNISH